MPPDPPPNYLSCKIHTCEHMFTLMNLITTPYLRIMMQFATDPMSQYYQRELSRICGVSIGATNQFVKRLVQTGFVTQEKRGKMYFYRLDLKNPAVRQFKILLNIDGLNTLINGVRERVRRIVIFGSCAQGTDIKESDIDLFVLTTEKDYIRRMIREYNRKNERKISPIIVGANEFVNLKREDKPLYENVERGITLWEAE